MIIAEETTRRTIYENNEPVNNYIVYRDYRCMKNGEGRHAYFGCRERF